MEEEALLVEAHRKFGNKWAKIAECLPGRTDNAIKNHWNSALRRELRRLNRQKPMAPVPPPPSTTVLSEIPGNVRGAPGSPGKPKDALPLKTPHGEETNAPVIADGVQGGPPAGAAEAPAGPARPEVPGSPKLAPTLITSQSSGLPNSSVAQMPSLALPPPLPPAETPPSAPNNVGEAAVAGTPARQGPPPPEYAPQGPATEHETTAPSAPNPQPPPVAPVSLPPGAVPPADVGVGSQPASRVPQPQPQPAPGPAPAPGGLRQPVFMAPAIGHVVKLPPAGRGFGHVSNGARKRRGEAEPTVSSDIAKGTRQVLLKHIHRLNSVGAAASMRDALYPRLPMRWRIPLSSALDISRGSTDGV